VSDKQLVSSGVSPDVGEWPCLGGAPTLHMVLTSKVRHRVPYYSLGWSANDTFALTFWRFCLSSFIPHYLLHVALYTVLSSVLFLVLNVF